MILGIAITLTTIIIAWLAYRRGWRKGCTYGVNYIAKDIEAITAARYQQFIESDAGQDWLHTTRQRQPAKRGMQ